MTENAVNDTHGNTYIRELDIIRPSPDASVTIWVTNGIIEVKVYEYGCQNNLSRYKKISGSAYVDIETGEIIRFQSKTGRGGTGGSDRRNWNKSFERLRRIINYNFVGNGNELHIILTYGSDCHMTDRGIVSDDFKNFMKRLRYNYGHLEYIVMYEPDCRGIWHIHVLVKTNDTDRLFIENRSVQDIWGNGYTKVRRTSGNDNIGAYFTVLLGGSGNSKKASRIQYYERYKKLYTKSRGILIPPPRYMTYREAEQFLQGHRKVYEKGYAVHSRIDGCEVNRIYTMQYNDRRK